MDMDIAKPKKTHEIRDTLAISVPLVTSQLVYASSSFVSTAMVAVLGKEALAATVLVNMIWMCLSVFFFGILNATSALVAREYGKKNHEAISRIMGQSLILSLIITICVCFALSSIPFFIHLSAQPPEVLRLAKAYNASLIWLVPALVLLITLEQFLAGINRTKLVLRISMLVVPIEIPLIYILMFGKCGLPVFGVEGIGIGLAISYTITALGLSLYLLLAKHYQVYQISRHAFHLDWPLFKSLLNVGFPFGFIQIIEISSFSLMTFWLGHFGTVLLAAHQITMQYLTFFVTLVFSMSQAVMIRVSHVLSSGQRNTLYSASYVGLGLNTLVVGCLALLYFKVPHLFLAVDINATNPNNLLLVKDASTLLALSGLLLFIDNFRIVGMGALRGLKENQFPLIATFFAFWVVGCPAAYLLGFYYQFGGVGIWLGLIIGVASGAILTQWKLLRLIPSFSG